jgi:carbon storage regulator CsrA
MNQKPDDEGEGVQDDKQHSGGMLIISRRKQEKLIVVGDAGGDIEITVLELGRNRVRLGIRAPKEVHISTRLKASPPESSTASSETME